MRKENHLNQQHFDSLQLRYNDLNLASLGKGMASWSHLDGIMEYHMNLHRHTWLMHHQW